MQRDEWTYIEINFVVCCAFYLTLPECILNLPQALEYSADIKSIIIYSKPVTNLQWLNDIFSTNANFPPRKFRFLTKHRNLLRVEDPAWNWRNEVSLFTYYKIPRLVTRGWIAPIHIYAKVAFSLLIGQCTVITRAERRFEQLALVKQAHVHYARVAPLSVTRCRDESCFYFYSMYFILRCEYCFFDFSSQVIDTLKEGIARKKYQQQYIIFCICDCKIESKPCIRWVMIGIAFLLMQVCYLFEHEEIRTQKFIIQFAYFSNLICSGKPFYHMIDEWIVQNYNYQTRLCRRSWKRGWIQLEI